MEYVEGQTVRELLAEKWELKKCVDLLLQVTEGLADAHKKGITHRDIKPENIIIASDGTAKLMDFGLALTQGAVRLTAAEGVCGTYWYMAPEQVRGERNIGPAADVYAVGCMAYELLSGVPPFTGDDVGIQHLAATPKPLTEVRPDIPDRLAGIVMKCLAKEPSARYPDAGSLNAGLRGIEDSQ
jgi:serine/threonine-protein kinase